MNIEKFDKENFISETNRFIKKISRNNLVCEDQLDKWLIESSFEDIGKLYVCVTEHKFNQSISRPNLMCLHDYFIAKYFLICISLNPNNKWADSRYTAAIDASNWFSEYIKISKSRKSQMLIAFVNFLEKMYLKASHDVKTCIINGFLEHVDWNETTKQYFISWKKSSELNEAFLCGLDSRRDLPSYKDLDSTVSFSKKDIILQWKKVYGR